MKRAAVGKRQRASLRRCRGRPRAAASSRRRRRPARSHCLAPAQGRNVGGVVLAHRCPSSAARRSRGAFGRGGVSQASWHRRSSGPAGIAARRRRTAAACRRQRVLRAPRRGRRSASAASLPPARPAVAVDSGSLRTGRSTQHDGGGDGGGGGADEERDDQAAHAAACRSMRDGASCLFSRSQALTTVLSGRRRGRRVPGR